jgi:hypothetical protein
MPKEQTEVYRDRDGADGVDPHENDGRRGSLAITLVRPAEGGVAEYREGAAPQGETYVETLVAPGEWWVT